MLGVWYRFIARLLGGTKMATLKMVFCDQVVYLKLSTLGKIFSRRHIEIFFLFFHENRFK